MSAARRVAVLGSGPAALLAADVLSEGGARVELFEKRRSLGRKLLVAGSSGLNITNSLPPSEFAAQYRHAGSPSLWPSLLRDFPPARWIEHIEGLGVATFEGSGGRWFVEGMKAAALLSAWRDRLVARGVEIRLGRECDGFSVRPEGGVRLSFVGGSAWEGDAAVLALGGASWEPDEVPLRWPAMFRERGIALDPFVSSNAGWEVAWSPGLLREAEGQPLKRVKLRTALGERAGELTITAYGLEGTPVYTLGTPGPATLDLLPDVDAGEIAARLGRGRENLAPLRRIERALALGPAAQALLFHESSPEWRTHRDWSAVAERIKAFPLTLLRPRPLAEAISSSGGVSLSEVDETLMLRKFPGIYCAGEMLSWDAPTGGFLIQGAVATGYRAARAALG